MRARVADLPGLVLLPDRRRRGAGGLAGAMGVAVARTKTRGSALAVPSEVDLDLYRWRGFRACEDRRALI